MDWIKVTPETMPPEGEPVMVTAKRSDGNLYFYALSRMSEKSGVWEWAHTFENGEYQWYTILDKVTHWMPFPLPPED